MSIVDAQLRPDPARELDEARARLAAAALAAARWQHRHSPEGRTHVRDGHDAISLIDAATRALHAARATLITELRADEDEHAARVDQMIAEFRAARACDAPPAA